MKNLLNTSMYTSVAMISMCVACAHQSKTSTETAAPAASPSSAVSAPAPLTSDPTSSADRSVSIAQSVLKPGKNQKIRGILHFTQNGDKLKVDGMLENLKPGKHGLHIHEVGDCSAPDFASAGGHFNPTHSTHGSSDSSERHAGDLGNVRADRKGRAKVSVEVTGLSMSGPNSILNRAIVVHSGDDDFKTQPSGNSGDRIACGRIEANQ
jgi:Cu-Zn family superoxide dismutase